MDRKGTTHKFVVGGHKGYITVSFYEDGRPAEVFFTVAKDGSTLSGLMKTIAILTSVCLQHGISIEYLRQKFDGMKFEPSGATTNSDIPIAESIVDYTFKWIDLEVKKRKK